MPVIQCGCGVQLRYTITADGRGEEWGDEVFDCEEMRPKLAAAKPHQRVKIQCDRLSRLIQTTIESSSFTQS